MTGRVDSDERFVDVPGGAVFTKSWGISTCRWKTPVILFHDSIGCVAMWRQFPQSLSAHLDRPVIAYDRLGFGKSSERRDILSANFVSEEAQFYLPVILRELGIQQFVAFGHSVGGAMAVVAAARVAGQCRAVITESAQAFVEARTLEAIEKAKLRFQDPQELLKLERYHGAKARWVVDAWTDTWLSAEFLRWSLEPDLRRVLSPLLAIHGDQDEYGSTAFPDALTSTTGGPAEKLIVWKCGHVPHREREDEVLNAVQEFLDRSIGADEV